MATTSSDPSVGRQLVCLEAEAEAEAVNNNNNNQQNNNSVSDPRPSDMSSSSSTDGLCRICFSGGKYESLQSPCLCKGTVANVHISCLEHWLSQSNTQKCDLCGFPFKTIRKPKYSIRYSLFYWIFKETENDYRQGLAMDILIFSIMTPIVISAVYICASVGNFYARESLLSSPSTWTSVAMWVTVLLLTFGYYLWVSVAIRLHGKNWYRWWQAHNEVKLLWRTGEEDVMSTSTSARLVVVETTIL